MWLSFYVGLVGICGSMSTVAQERNNTDHVNAAELNRQSLEISGNNYGLIAQLDRATDF